LRLPIDTHTKLTTERDLHLQDTDQYRRLVGKLLYLTITRPDVNYIVHLLSQFLQNPTNEHMKAVLMC